MAQQNLQFESITSSFLFFFLVSSTCSCISKKAPSFITGYLFQVTDHKTFGELEDSGFVLSKNTDFIALYKHFGDTSSNTDTLVYYQFSGNTNKKSTAIARFISIPLRTRDRNYLESFFAKNGCAIIAEPDTINQVHFYRVKNLKNSQTFNCSIEKTDKSELYELNIGYSYLTH